MGEQYDQNRIYHGKGIHQNTVILAGKALKKNVYIK